MTQGLLILGLTHREEGLEEALDMPHVLQALGDLRQPPGNQRLDLFTEGQVSRLERQQGPHVFECKSGCLGRTDETNDLQGLLGIEPILVFRPRSGPHQSRAIVIAQRRDRYASGVRQLANHILLCHNEKLFITYDALS